MRIFSNYRLSMEEVADPPSCCCGGLRMKLAFGAQDYRFQDGVHSLHRCIKRWPVGTRCKCGEITARDAFTYSFRGGRRRSEDLELTFARHVPWVGQKWLLFHGRVSYLHDVERCIPLKDWIEGK